MQFLVSKVKHWKKKAHIWDGGDTFCRMYSTGGLRQEKYEVTDSNEGKLICQMCRNKHDEPNSTKDHRDN